MASYLPLLKDKNVGLVVNHTSFIGEQHLVDTLKSLRINIVKLFAPEHGFRGKADAGAHISDSMDTKTGIRITSLYGDKKKPDASDLKGVDILLFDIQDVGVRFYTYISTMMLIMEAAGENGIPVIILDRPNPNGHYLDGPVLDTSKYKSFVGMMPIPVVYGMTMGELAQMINGEQWIQKPCSLDIIPCQNYDHKTAYTLPVKPSPNLPNQRSVLLYPGICFFEGTSLSLGRGTSTPFQVVGHPDYPDKTFSFIPHGVPGAMNPPLKDKTCYGINLSHVDVDSLFQTKKMDISILLRMYKVMDKEKFFNSAWFDKLAGNATFRAAIEAGWNESEIRESWDAELEAFNVRRKRYLLYSDF